MKELSEEPKNYLQEITPIRIEWNSYNGFMLDILSIEAGIFGHEIDSHLFSISFGWKCYLHISILFMNFEWEWYKQEIK